jgi:hypothetical protein
VTKFALGFAGMMLLICVIAAIGGINFQYGQDMLKLNPRCSSRGTFPEFDAVSQTVKLFDHYDCKVKR